MQEADVDQLAIKIEEAARSTEQGVRYFIEPAPNTLRRAVARRHHVIFGRRGSGKSSLLRKAAADLTVDRRPIAVVNLEAFKSHSYPDVLLSVLISTFTEFKNWIETAAINPANKTTFWKRLFASTPTRPAFNKKECEAVAKVIGDIIKALEDQLHAEDAAIRTTTTSEQTESSSSAGLSAGLESPAAKLSGKIGVADKSSAGETIQEVNRRTKIDFLHRRILEYQNVFRSMAKISGGDSYLFLDDLYQIRRADQPNVVDYFHRIAKDNGLWLKIGTIRYRSDWYRLGNPPIGVKLGDDADEIDLDVTLEKYATAKQFLLSILKKFADECNISVSDILTAGAQDRLVLASGGVARDFLAIFRKSIQVCRERADERISAEDVNQAAGEYESSKREDFRRDSAEDEEKLDSEFQGVVDFCLRQNETNCFLIDKATRGGRVDLIHELVDLKLLHLARSRVTVRSRPGEIYEAYMLDFSQYSGARKRRGLKVIEFWKHDSQDQLRKPSLIYGS